MAVRTAGLAKTYRSGLGRRPIPALAGLDLEVPKGRVFGLLGPNGAGKTTLVKLLLAIAFPTSGKAEVLGRPPGDLGARARIGYLPESHRYPAHLTGEQVLHHFGRLSGLHRPERDRRVEHLLARLRMTEWRALRVRKYSKGMMQRLGMAQALINQPELLILDEPTDGVDPIGRHEIRDLLLEQKDRGTTIFLNSHLLSEVERLCDRVAILKDGRLLRQGSVEELTRPGGSFALRVRGLDPEALRALCARHPGLVAAPPRPGESDGRLDLRGDLAELNRLIDALRSESADIAAIEPVKESLEEVFVKVIGENEP
ncbi:MAG TPA: ABC transporter ATP-binding protein [Candidatus Polarisedimenticolia bacterium]|nr:ABC transporter ATP-binding protein [Candidatus Polarisedimenticolia bacterium]